LEFGVRGLKKAVKHDIAIPDFPIGKIPISERVDPLTIGVRGFELHVTALTEFARSRIPISRFPKGRSPKELTVGSGLPSGVEEYFDS
jgi:hypothetical protein